MSGNACSHRCKGGVPVNPLLLSRALKLSLGKVHRGLHLRSVMLVSLQKDSVLDLM